MEFALLRTHLSLKRLVVFVDILFPILVHFMLDLIMLLFGVICVIPLTMTLVARFGMNNACCGLETPFDEVHHLVDTLL